ncbi:DUF6479 family protein [Streptomyces sp. NPDC059582]|uniref:DUF6479 family protein n=1 Tax=Streptomyces sp. NPDC059582 TaxID=3346875 RepID=UPI0036C5AF22
MIETHITLAVSSVDALGMAVAGIAVVAVLIAAFVFGSRRAAQANSPLPRPGAAQARQDLAHPEQRGEGWSTPDDDPEQGHPHR